MPYADVRCLRYLEMGKTDPLPPRVIVTSLLFVTVGPANEVVVVVVSVTVDAGM